MSADNFIFVNRKNFEVNLMGASDNNLIAKLGKGKDLNDAVDIASKKSKEWPVEYGIWFGEK